MSFPGRTKATGRTYRRIAGWNVPGRPPRQLTRSEHHDVVVRRSHERLGIHVHGTGQPIVLGAADPRRNRYVSLPHAHVRTRRANGPERPRTVTRGAVRAWRDR